MDRPQLPLDILHAVGMSSDDDSGELLQALEALERAFERAAALYDARDYSAAADAFLVAARSARGHDNLAANRASCYRNAAKAWSMAKLLEENRPLLDEAAREDPLCTDAIRHILEILGPPLPSI